MNGFTRDWVRKFFTSNDLVNPDYQIFRRLYIILMVWITRKNRKIRSIWITRSIWIIRKIGIIGRFGLSRRLRKSGGLSWYWIFGQSEGFGLSWAFGQSGGFGLSWGFEKSGWFKYSGGVKYSRGFGYPSCLRAIERRKEGARWKQFSMRA